MSLWLQVWILFLRLVMRISSSWCIIVYTVLVHIFQNSSQRKELKWPILAHGSYFSILLLPFYAGLSGLSELNVT